MITLRRGDDRHHDRRRDREVWRTFGPRAPANRGVAEAFGALELLDEHRLAPGAVLPRAVVREVEILTYVCEGALTHSDSRGRSGIVRAGEVLRATAARGVRRRDANASRTDEARVFQIQLHPGEADLDPAEERNRFCTADRRGRLCILASPDGRKGSLHLGQDSRVYSAILYSGQHLVHELSVGRSAWMHLVEGEITLDDTVLFAGDGAGILGERAVSLIARADSEILLVDLRQRARGPPEETGPSIPANSPPRHEGLTS